MFYKITAYVENMDKIFSVRDGCIMHEIACEMAEKSDEFFYNYGQACYPFAVKGKDHKMIFGAITKDVDDMGSMFRKYSKTLSVQVEKTEIEEITFKEWKGLLRTAGRNDFIASDVDIPVLFEISDLDGSFKEYMLEKMVSKDQMMETADCLLIGTTLKPELERIYMGGRSKKVTGHPVHYLIRTDDFVVSEKICKTLLSALLINGRIKSKRYCVVDCDNENRFPSEAQNALYQSCENGAVIVCYKEERLREMRYSRGREDEILGLCETAMRYKNKVLTIFVLPAECSKMKYSLLEKWDSNFAILLKLDLVHNS